jgi:hypothetical protein
MALSIDDPETDRLAQELSSLTGESIADSVRTALRERLERTKARSRAESDERFERIMALGRKNSLFAGSDGGACHWAIVASLVATAKLNGVEPSAWLTDVLERMVSGRTKAHELERLLPWAWKAERLEAAVNG